MDRPRLTPIRTMAHPTAMTAGHQTLRVTGILRKSVQGSRSSQQKRPGASRGRQPSSLAMGRPSFRLADLLARSPGTSSRRGLGKLATMRLRLSLPRAPSSLRPRLGSLASIRLSRCGPPPDGEIAPARASAIDVLEGAKRPRLLPSQCAAIKAGHTTLADKQHRSCGLWCIETSNPNSWTTAEDRILCRSAADYLLVQETKVFSLNGLAALKRSARDLGWNAAAHPALRTAASKGSGGCAVLAARGTGPTPPGCGGDP